MISGRPPFFSFRPLSQPSSSFLGPTAIGNSTLNRLLSPQAPGGYQPQHQDQAFSATCMSLSRCHPLRTSPPLLRPRNPPLLCALRIPVIPVTPFVSHANRSRPPRGPLSFATISRSQPATEPRLEMPRKAKKEKAASTPEASPSSNSTDVAQLSRPEVQLRRSGRRIALPSDDGEEETREIQAKVLGHKPDQKGMLYNYSDESEERAAQTKEGVQLAINGLVTMERRLKMATKTQKQKVAKTTFADHLERPDPNASDAESDSMRASALRKEEPSTQEQLRSNKTEQKAPKGRHAARQPELPPIDEVGDAGPVDAGEPDAMDPAERGAARPPPVNSDRLPLPWKGRLGYV